MQKYLWQKSLDIYAASIWAQELKDKRKIYKQKTKKYVNTKQSWRNTQIDLRCDKKKKKK